MIFDTNNEMFRLAVEMVNQSSRSIFLTGKAGTGKTTFLRYIRKNCSKQMAVVAPTGVAAINAGGATIHSFFQLPLMPFIPEARGFSSDNEETVGPHNLISRLRMNKEKLRVLRELELLVIDEISMVRCDTMDAIDIVLRHVRKTPMERFGGVQMLFIGDMFQLPPVIRDDTWSLLSAYYNSPYFFESRVVKEEKPIYIEFNKIYRQNDERFINLLNQVRNNQMDEGGMAILKERFNPEFQYDKDDGYIVLTTHNETAREINGKQLRELEGPVASFKAGIEGEFPENSYPADGLLQLKTGAQVMFIKNDADKAKRYYNGKIGIVTELKEDAILVECKDDQLPIEVKKEKWDNIRYALDKKTNQIGEEVLGSFSQYPLRLAWAITIHKSQGLTFEKAIIDAGKAFATGQVYVALSRCTSLEGIVLKSLVNKESLVTDPRIVNFSRAQRSSAALQQELAIAKRAYQERSLLLTFDLKPVIDTGRELEGYILEHHSSFNKELPHWFAGVLSKAILLQETAVKFHTWLKMQFSLTGELEDNKPLQERLLKATDHFLKELESIIGLIQSSPALTDSRLHAKEYNEGLRELFAGLSLQRFLLQSLDGVGAAGRWHSLKKEFVLPPFSVNAYAGAAQVRIESPHPQLHLQLRKLRDSICSKKDLPIYMVAGSKSIDEMATYLPLSEEALEEISGFGKKRVQSYGTAFLELIQEYCGEKGLKSMIEEKSKKSKPKAIRETKSNTKAESLRLHRQGLKVAEIADQRNLSPQTIESHLAHYVENGEIDIDELVSADARAMIMPHISDDLQGQGGLSSVKAKLGAGISFGEIRLVIAWLAYNGTKKE